MVITLLVKYLAAPIAAVYHMVTNAANRGSCAAGHNVNVANNLANGHNKRACPVPVPFSFFFWLSLDDSCSYPPKFAIEHRHYPSCCECISSTRHTQTHWRLF